MKIVRNEKPDLKPTVLNQLNKLTIKLQNNKDHEKQRQRNKDK